MGMRNNQPERPADGSASRIAMTSAGGTVLIQPQAERDFNRARQRAAFQDLLSFLRHDSPNLLPFEAVRQRLGLGEKVYRGIQSIPTNQVVGSVGRYNDFTRTFLPRSETVRTRWQKIGQLTSLRGMPPIQVYQVGMVYFVLDGNHRVSVARQTGAETIDAHVWEYETRVPLEPDDALEDVLVRQEYLEFLERTQLDQSRPDVYIILTQPGRYRDFEEQIAIHRHYLELERGSNISFTDAAVDWFDHVYLPMVDVIHQDRLLRLFPGRTEGDLVNWIVRNQGRLRQRYCHNRTASRLAEGVASQLQRNPWQRFISWFRRKILRWPVYTGEPWQQ